MSFKIKVIKLIPVPKVSASLAPIVIKCWIIVRKPVGRDWSKLFKVYVNQFSGSIVFWAWNGTYFLGSFWSDFRYWWLSRNCKKGIWINALTLLKSISFLWMKYLLILPGKRALTMMTPVHWISGVNIFIDQILFNSIKLILCAEERLHLPQMMQKMFSTKK